MQNKTKNSVTVITGASSGIGRATAVLFAKRGSNVVIAARRGDGLNETAAACQRHGVEAVVVPTDVVSEEAVEKLSSAAIEKFGRIDTWVNNAGIGVWGQFDKTPVADFRRVIDVNLMGYVYGCREAMLQFRKQKHGTLINVASVDACIAMPYVSSYIASKWAVRGMSACLRQELFLEGLNNVHVCVVMPATIDTPFFQHAANYTGYQVQAMRPVYPASKVARTIVRLAQAPRREVFVGLAGRLIALQYALEPGITEKAMAILADRKHLNHHKSASLTTGSLYRPMREGMDISGGWLNEKSWMFRRLLPLIALPIAAAAVRKVRRRSMTLERRLQ